MNTASEDIRFALINGTTYRVVRNALDSRVVAVQIEGLKREYCDVSLDELLEAPRPGAAELFGELPSQTVRAPDTSERARCADGAEESCEDDRNGRPIADTEVKA